MQICKQSIDLRWSEVDLWMAAFKISKYIDNQEIRGRIMYLCYANKRGLHNINCIELKELIADMSKRAARCMKLLLCTGPEKDRITWNLCAQHFSANFYKRLFSLIGDLRSSTYNIQMNFWGSIAGDRER
jgi:hypothetical protein